MSFKYTIIKLFKYSPKTQLIFFKKVTSVFINLNYIIVNLNKPFLV